MNGAEGLLGIASAFKGFNEGMKDAEDRKYKQMEAEAKVNAKLEDRERQRFQDKLEARKAGFLVPEGDGDMDPATMQYDPQYLALKRKIGAGGGAGPIKDDPFSTDLRTKWLNDPTTKATREVMAGYDKVKVAAQNPTAAGDLSLIFGYMKMLDPGSTVREGEFANAQNAAGVPDQIRNMYEKVRAGTRLSPQQRRDFLNQAKNVYKSQYGNQERFSSSIRGIAQRRGLRGEDIALDDMFLNPANDEDVVIPDDEISPVEAGNEGLLSKGAGLVKRFFMGSERPAGDDKAAKMKRLQELKAKAGK